MLINVYEDGISTAYEGVVSSVLKLSSAVCDLQLESCGTLLRRRDITEINGRFWRIGSSIELEFGYCAVGSTNSPNFVAPCNCYVTRATAPTTVLIRMI